MTWIAMVVLVIGIIGAPFVKGAVARRGAGSPLAYGAGFALLAAALLIARRL